MTDPHPVLGFAEGDVPQPAADRAGFYGWHGDRDPDAPRLRFAYADPPYVGEGSRYDHPDAGRWDDPSEHAALLHRLDALYDGWALSCKPLTLGVLLPDAPEGVRVAAWVKPWCAFRPQIRVPWTWEPVVWKRTAPTRRGDPWARDHVSTPMAMGRGVLGAKPEAFAGWVLDLLGWQVGDVLVDVFPGSGVFGRVVAERLL